MHNYNDAGQQRSHSGGYCGVRAMVIATGMDWKSAERHLRDFTRRGKAGDMGLLASDGLRVLEESKMTTTQLSYDGTTSLILRWMHRLRAADKNRDEKLRAAAHKALDEIDAAIEAAPNAAGPFAIPTRLVF
jgi:hypothetical protein